MRIKKRILQKIFSSFSALILLLNSFVPYLPVSIVYSNEPLQTNITYSDNSFKLSANTNEELTYLVAYKTPGNIEGTASTKVEKSDSNFSKEIYAGIKSGPDNRKDEVVRGIYKLEALGSFNAKRFIFEAGSLKVVDETSAGSLEVTVEDTNWLETGTDTIEQVCANSTTIDNNTYIDWNIDTENKIAETKEKVQVGITYVFPLENKVTVKFNCLPKNEALRTTLKIQQVKVTDLKLPESVNPATEYAYDITTGMKDGGFKYEVTLPKLENQDASVSYIEKTVDEAKNETVKEEEVKSTEESKTTQENEQVKVIELDHFTIYITTYSDSGFSIEEDTYTRGETVYIKAGDLNTNKYYKIRLNPNGSGGDVDSNCFDPTPGNNFFTFSYLLPLNAKLGSWDAELRQYKNSNCNNYESTPKTDAFTVLDIKPDLVVSKTNNVDGNTIINNTFNWIITLTNNGNASATFDNKTILVDDLPGYASYSISSVTKTGGTTGNIDCNITNDWWGNKSLSCSDGSGVVVIPTGGSITVYLDTTPTQTGTLTNPRYDYWGQTQCKVDPNNNISESDETNNKCSNSVTVTQYIAPNPTLSSSCGLDVALVLDNSGSVGSNLATMKTNFKNFIDDLAGTPTQYSVTYFDGTAHIQQGFTSNSTTAKNAIDAVPNAEGSTNWQDGLLKAKLTFDPRPTVPNLIIFSSDGDPNKYYTNITDENNPTGLTGPGNGYDQASHNASISLANTIKTQGSRIITLGIGNDSSMQTHMEAISSSDAYYNASNFDELSIALNDIVTDLCGGTISVTKLIEGTATAGWDYSVSVTNGTPNPINGTTDESGKINFDINPTVGGSATASVVETIKNGYQIVSASCSTPTHSVGTFDGVDSVDGIIVGNSDVISCTFNNTKATGKIELQKHWIGPAGGAYFNIGSSQQASDIASEWISGSDGTSGEKTVPVGNYYVSETLPTSSHYTGTLACYNDLNDNDVVDDGDTTHDVDIATGEVAVGNNEDVICVFTNTHDTGSIFGTKYEDLNSSGSRDTIEGSENTEPGLEGWTINLYDDTGAVIDTKTTDSKGDYEFLNLITGNYKVCEVLQTAWENTDPGDSKVCKDVIVTKDETTNANFGNKRTPVIIKASKIVCDSEEDLPNMSGGANINADTANNFVQNSNGKCRFADGWDFQWGFADKASAAGVDKLIGTHIGTADGTPSSCSTNCGPNTQTGAAYNEWKTFGQTDSNNYGITEVAIDDLEGAPGIWVRESLQENYIPFTYPPQSSPGSNVSAEIYCHNDVEKYDNYDQIVSPQYGQTYYCVAFNALNATSISGKKFNDINSNGIDDDEPGLENWTIYAAEQLEEETIDALNTPKVTSNWILQDGQKYLIRVTGTYDANDSITADAKYSVRSPNTVWTDSVQNYESYGPTLLDLQINNTSPDWGTYNPEHVYWLTYTGTGTPIDFEIYDLNNGNNNSGSLNIIIYKVIQETKTDVNGNYNLDIVGEITEGVIITEQTQTDWTQTAPTGAGFGYCNLNLYTQNDCNFGNHYSPDKGSISGRKWEDLNSDGVWDSGEPIVDGTVTPIKIFVDTNGNGQYDGLPSEYYATIDYLGRYSFGGLVPGTYNICEKDDELTDWIRTYPTDSNCQSVTVNANTDTTADFGNVHKGNVTVYKFEDLNKNGFYDNNEPLLPNWDIVMNQVDGAGQTQKTDENGQTAFELNPTDYILSENIQDGWVQTGISCGNDIDRQLITSAGEAYGHHGECSGWNECGDAATCAQWACEIKGYGYLASYGDQKPCTQFNNCNLFYSRGNIQWNWGNWCNVMGVTDIYCSNTPIESDNSYELTVLPGDQVNCYIGNIHFGKVNITKYHDVNQDGVKQETEPVLSGWDITLNSDTKTTSTDGQVIFEDLISTNSYTLSETILGGWKQTNISCSGEKAIDNDNSHTVTVNAGETTYCEIGNYKIPSVSISKYNNKWPLNGTLGGEVIFTMLLSIFDNDVKDLHVMDLLPAGFTFKPGSAKMDGVTMATQPAYHSPGDWQIGDVSKGQDIRLEYSATIDSNQEPGLYKDLAFAYGCEVTDTCEIENDDLVLAQSVDSGQTDPGVITENYVGTQVNLTKEQQESASADVKKTETGEVLGASTSLPGTGSKTIWIIVSTIFTLLGIMVLAFGLALKSKKYNLISKLFSFILVFVSFFLIGSSNTYAQLKPLSIRLEQPQSPTRLNEFKLIFTTMDMKGVDPITVRCFKNSSQFGNNITVTAGGNTGSCQVNSSVISSKGTYSFYVTAQTTTDTVTSETVTVDYNTEGPGTPGSYSKEHSSDCQYKIHFKTSDDGGKTVKVEVYRSKDTSFNLDSGTRTASISIGSNTEHNYTDNLSSDCDKTWYYAVRAFDTYGNGSGWVGDSEITVTGTSTTTTQTTTETTGAIPVVNVTLPSAEVLGEKTSISPTTTQKQKEEVMNVLGASVTKQNRNLIIGSGIGVILAAIIGYVLYKKKVSNLKS